MPTQCPQRRGKRWGNAEWKFLCIDDLLFSVHYQLHPDNGVKNKVCQGMAKKKENCEQSAIDSEWNSLSEYGF